MPRSIHASQAASGCFASAVFCVVLAGCGSRPLDDETAARSRSAIEGELTIYGGIALDGTRILEYALRARDGSELALDFSKARIPALGSGAHLRVRGERGAPPRFQVEDWDIVRASAPRIDALAQPLIEHRPRRVAAILVHWGEPASFTTEDIRQVLLTGSGSAAALFAESSFGKSTFEGDVFGWYAIPEPESCDINQIASSARSAAMAREVNVASYDHLAYVVSSSSAACNFSGLGQIGLPASPSRETWYNGFSGPYLFAHELGHNLGYFHSQSYVCGSDAIAERAACTFDEYGDPFDAMGTGTTHFNAYHKAAQNWFPSCSVVTTPRDGVFDLAPIESSSTGIQALRIPLSASLCPIEAQEPCYYYVERRQPLGAFDGVEPYASSPMVQGVLIHAALGVDTAGSTLLSSPYLLDATPASGHSFGELWDASLQAGRGFADRAGVRVRVMSESSSSVRVAVRVPGGSGSASCLDGTRIAGNAGCDDGVKNGGESAVDCGGTACVPCDDGRTCMVAADCWSNRCVSGACAPGCDDGLRNGDETDVDCGGSCGDCDPGRRCVVAGDCASNRCTTSGYCTSDQLRATLSVNSNWQTGFCGIVDLHNRHDRVTREWSIEMKFEHSTFTTTSGAAFNPVGDGLYRLTPAEWNCSIWPSSHATITFCATKTGPRHFPELRYTTVQY